MTVVYIQNLYNTFSQCLQTICDCGGVVRYHDVMVIIWSCALSETLLQDNPSYCSKVIEF